MDEFKVDDRVRMHDDDGSWVDGKEGVITTLNVISSDGIKGHCIQVPGVGITVVHWSQLERL